MAAGGGGLETTSAWSGQSARCNLSRSQPCGARAPQTPAAPSQHGARRGTGACPSPWPRGCLAGETPPLLARGTRLSAPSPRPRARRRLCAAGGKGARRRQGAASHSLDGQPAVLAGVSVVTYVIRRRPGCSDARGAAAAGSGAAQVGAPALRWPLRVPAPGWLCRGPLPTPDTCPSRAGACR